jgi:hypothetical protein
MWSCAENWQWLLSFRQNNCYDDVTLLREGGNRDIVRVRKDVMLLREGGDIVIVRVRKDFMLLRERGERL